MGDFEGLDGIGKPVHIDGATFAVEELPTIPIDMRHLLKIVHRDIQPLADIGERPVASEKDRSSLEFGNEELHQCLLGERGLFNPTDRFVE
mmetsp:Transcript_20864/g.32545  ORF Transcript_20864/g.32545 Transcript_20864/m.32545 type:complete len:91 (-) Transcript_20864:60-332(-)